MATLIDHSRYSQIFNLSSRCLATICDLSQSRRREKERQKQTLIYSIHTYIYIGAIFTTQSHGYSNRLKFLFTFSLTISRGFCCAFRILDIFFLGFSFFQVSYFCFFFFLAVWLVFFSSPFLAILLSAAATRCLSEIVKNSAVAIPCKNVEQ